jgi:alpha-glucoside transport system permease protein
VILTAGSVLVTTVLACLAAYAFSHMRFVGRDTLFVIIIALMVIPNATSSKGWRPAL